MAWDLFIVLIVTYITITGSTMVDWNRGLLIQGETTVIMVNVCALGHFVGWSASIKGSRSPRHRKQTRLDWEVEILVCSDEGRHSYQWVLGSATDRHNTLGTWWSSSNLTYNIGTVNGYTSHTDKGTHPEIEDLLSFTIAQKWVKPMSNQLLYMYNGI